MLSWPAFQHHRNDHLILGHRKRPPIPLRVRIPTSARSSHMYVIGMSGKGKSKLLEHCLTQDIAAGRGCGLIDPHSLPAEDLLRLLITEHVLDSPEIRDRLRIQPARQATVACRDGKVTTMRTLTIPGYTATDAQVEALQRESMARYGTAYAEAQGNVLESVEAAPHPPSEQATMADSEIPAYEIVTR